MDWVLWVRPGKSVNPDAESNSGLGSVSYGFKVQMGYKKCMKFMIKTLDQRLNLLKLKCSM